MHRAIILATAAALAACTNSGPDPAAAERDLRRTNAAYDKALVDGDAAALNRFYADDFQIIDDDAEVSDKQDQIRFMTKEVDLLDAKSDDVRISMLGPDSALMTGRVTGRYRYRGEENDFVERYTAVWVRDGENWRLKHEHSSIEPEAPAQQSG